MGHNPITPPRTITRGERLKRSYVNGAVTFETFDAEMERLLTDGIADERVDPRGDIVAPVRDA